MRLQISNNVAEGPGIRISGHYPILDARLVGDRVFVIYDYMEFDKGAPARNLFCYDRSGAELWRAADIGSGSSDAYTNVLSETPLWVNNFSSFRCRIDERTGAVLETEFTK